jgi:hypothetical protein
MTRFASNQIPTGGAFNITTQSDEIQKSIASTNIVRQFADVQKQVDASDIVKQFNDAQKNLAYSDFTKQIADVQKQIDASGIVKQFNDVQKNLAYSGFTKQIADVQKQIGASGFSKQLDDFRKQLAGTDVASVHSALGRISQRVREDQTRWDQIEHSFGSLSTQKNELQVAPIRIPNIAERFQRSLNARLKVDHDARVQQSELLASIAEAGKKQNETMAEMTKLQSMLVEEALENTKTQRTLLYFTALSVAFALFALLIR